MPLPPQPSPPDPTISLVLSTFEREEDATEIIRALLREGLIACGTLLRSARSIYVWEDDVHDTQEILVLCKTATELAKAAAARLAELHPYDVPEILAFTTQANPPYADWINASTRPGNQSKIEIRDSKIP